MPSNILPSRVMHRSLIGSGMLLCCVSAVGQGQQRPGPQAPQSVESSRVISAEFPRPLMKPHGERYTHAAVHYCEALAGRIADSVAWGRRTDTIPWGPSDTLPTDVRRRAGQCMAQVKIERVGRLFFEAAANLALVAGNDSLLPPVIDSLIIMERDGREAGNNWYPGVAGRFFRTLLSAAPARVELARRMLARNDLLNGSAYPQGKGNKLILTSRTQMYEFLHEFGRNIADVRLMEEGRDSMLALVHAFEKAYPDSVNELDRVSRNAVALRMTRYVYAFRFGSDSIFKNVEREIALFETVFPGREKENRDLLGVSLTGMHAPPADVPFTFFRDGVTRIPEPGRAMVVLRVGENCEADCAAEVMRFKSKLGDVPLVLIAEVFGNVRRSNPGTAAENAEALRAHLQDSLGVTLPLVVDTAPRYVLPAPDLRHLYGQSRLMLNWMAATSAVFGPDPSRVDARSYFVVNKRGQVVWGNAFYTGQRDNKRFVVGVIRKIAEE